MSEKPKKVIDIKFSVKDQEISPVSAESVQIGSVPKLRWFVPATALQFFQEGGILPSGVLFSGGSTTLIVVRDDSILSEPLTWGDLKLTEVEITPVVKAK